MKKQLSAVLWAFCCCCSVCASGQSVPGYGSSVTQNPSYLSYEYVLINGQPLYINGIKNDITPPKLIHQPSPKYPKEARKAKFQGQCVLWLTVGVDGVPQDIKVTQSLGMGLDEAAIAAIKKWKFQPARINGQPVAVGTKVEVNFKLR